MRSAMRIRREAVGITQVQLAQALGVSQAFISEIETGRKAPGTMLATAIAGALTAPVESLWQADAIARVPTFYSADAAHPARLAKTAPASAVQPPASDPIREAFDRAVSRPGSALERTRAAIAALRKVEDLLVFAEVSR